MGNNSLKNTFLNNYCFSALPEAKSLVPKGFPIGFEMAEKNVNKQTNRHFRIYISRDL